MNRQYIGARYVPKFADPIAWDKANSYEALTIVTHLNNSYTSKKPVPANTEITDTEYWVVTGNYNAQVEEYRQETEKVKEDINDVKSDVNDVKSDVNDVKSDVVHIKNSLLNRKYLLLADSYGMRETSKPTWTELFVSRYSTARQKSTSSIGFATATSSEPNFSFVGKLAEFVSELTETERNEITDIVVCGGWNDARAITSGAIDVSGLQTKIFEFVDYANTNFPNATPWIGFIGWQSWKCVQPETNINDLNRVDVIYTYSQYKNLKHLINVNAIMKDSANLDETYFHPNPTGSSNLFIGISCALNGGYEYHTSRALNDADVTFNTADGVSGTLSNFYVTMENTKSIISGIISNLTVPSGVNNVLTFDGNALPCGSSEQAIFTVTDFTDKTSNYMSLSHGILNWWGSEITNHTIIFRVELDGRYDK